MHIILLFLIALGLSMDAFAVSVTNGMCHCRRSKKNMIATALTFGLFQAIMPFVGFSLCRTFMIAINQIQHWIALFLLGAIGVNMITDSLNERKQEDDCTKKNVFSIQNLMLQGFATSIDALAAGVSFAVMNVNIAFASLLIGFTTFCCCMVGVIIGRKFGSMLGQNAKLVGGIIIILIGIKIFIEHLIK